jgi:hypothetical protein
MLSNGTMGNFTSLIGLLLSLISLALMVLFGESDFSRMKLNGPFAVGFKEFRTS